MGSDGIKKRKPRRRLPKVQGDLPRSQMNEATSLSPAYVPQVYGHILRAIRSPHKRQRHAGAALIGLFGLLSLVVVVITVFAFATR